jgi:hypothetical protein
MGVSSIKKWLKNQFGHTSVERFKEDVLGSNRVAPWDVHKDSSGQIILQTKGGRFQIPTGEYIR